jgi:hypothetical protein
MATAIGLPPFAEFDLQPRETAPIRFAKYVKRLENLFAAMAIDDPDRQKAMFLHYIGESAHDVYETLTIPAVSQDHADRSTPLNCAVKAYKDHLEPHKCTDHLVYLFRKETQHSEETVAEFHTRLCLLAKKCDFGERFDLEIKRQIIQGTTSIRLRRKAIEQSLNLQQLLKTAYAMDTADGRTGEMEQSHAVQKSSTNRPKHKSYPSKSYPHTNHAPKQSFRKPDFRPTDNQHTTCGLCGGPYPHKGQCPARGVECYNCGKQNHYTKMCRSSRPNQNENQSRQPSNAPSHTKHRARAVDSTDDGQDITTCLAHENSDDEYTFHLTNSDTDTVWEKPYFDVTINGMKTKIMADSGATVNILNHDDYKKLTDRPPLLPSKSKIYPYMSEKPLNLCGKFEAELRNQQHSYRETFYVISGPSSSLLSWKTSQRLKLIQVVNTVSDAVDPRIPDVVKEFPNISVGMGACKGEPVKIHIDHSIKPVAQPHRRIPFHVRKKVEEKIRELEQSDIIEPAEGPTPWVSPIVVVPKPHDPDDVRICVDMRLVNRAIIRERHVIPTIDDIISDLNGCEVFSKLDLKQGYHQLLLHPDSRHLTTFSTHIGLFRYKRLNFGMSCSAEIFQKKIADIIRGIPGVRNISDDIYIGGRNDSEHDIRLHQVLQRLSDNNLTINIPKCEFRVPDMIFFGHKFSKAGISPDPKKVADLQAMTAPSNVTEVRSLLSSASFCARFIKDFALITKPIRQLTCKDQPWKWDKEQQTALENLKSALSTTTTLGYFDPEKPTTLFVDGSPIGLGAVLTQSDPVSGESNPLYYASYPLTATEARYPQIDREALSIYWSIKRFHLYLYGKEFTVVTDHKPLVSLFNNPTSKPSARIERWLMELQRYRFTVEYRPGKENPADYASRHPLTQLSDESDTTETEAYIAYIAKNAVPKALTLAEVVSSTKTDALLQAVMDCLKSGSWDRSPPNVSVAELSRFKNIQDELTCSDTVLLKSNRLVLPTELQERTVEIAHEGHLGIVKTKALMREKVWFPLMDKMVETRVRSCLACQIATPVPSKEPLKMTPLPSNPFKEVSVDFCYIEGETVLLMVDDYSRFPFVEPVSSTSAPAVIPKMDQIFSTFGTPEIVKSDNGPPFNGDDFAKFADTLAFKHRKVTPLWPRANGEVERFVKTLKKCVKTAKAEGKNWKRELQAFLRNYRTTPHLTTGVAPATLFLKRAVRNKLPQTTESDPVSEIVRKHDDEQKRKMKMYADNKQYVKPSDIDIGDSVLVRRPFNLIKGNTPYEPTPLTVTHINGTMITASDDDHSVTRNSSFFKRVNCDIPNTDAYRDINVEPSYEPAGQNEDYLDLQIQNPPESVPKTPVVTRTAEPRTTEPRTDSSVPLRRSTRVVKPPDRLDL